MKNLLSLIQLVFVSQWSCGDTIQVNSFFDEFDTPSGASVSLREAVRDAAEATEACRIEIASAGPLELATPIEIEPGSMPIEISVLGSGTRKIVPTDDFVGNSLFFSEDTRLTASGIHFDLKDREITAFDVRGEETFILTRCKIFNSWRRPVWVGAGTNVVISECEFEDLIGGALTLSGSARLDLKDSLFISVSGACVGVQPSASTGEISILNCTFAENLDATAVVSISTSFDPTISIRHCSFVDNLMTPYRGPSSTKIDHSLFARNFTASDPETLLSIEEISIAGFGATSLGYNLTDGASAVFDQSGDQTEVEVKISRLGHFGGAQRCCFPQAGSPAIDGGNANRTGISPSRDVRKFERKAATSVINFPNTIDIGAVETNPSGTILVTSKKTTGPGTLHQALLDCTEETNYIEFTNFAALGGIDLTESLSVPISGRVNINLNAHPTLLVELSAVGNTASLFRFNLQAGSDCEVSFQRIHFRDLKEQDFATGHARAAVQISGETAGAFAFHGCEFTDNVFGGMGAVAILDNSEAFFSECRFINNSVSDVRPWPGRGGAAIQIDQDGRAEFRNCYFEGNYGETGGVAHARSRLVSGVADLDSYLRFEGCTFVNNTSDLGGACIFGRDVSVERCTFAGNQGKGVIAISSRGESQVDLEISRCLFYQNSSNLQKVDSVELDVAEPGEFTLKVLAPSWTDEDSSYPGLFLAGDLGGSYHLGDLDTYNDRTQIKSRPLIEETLPVIPEADYLPRYEYSFDGLGERGQDSEFVTRPGTTLRFSRVLPGAMQRTIEANFLPDVIVHSTRLEGEELVLQVEATVGRTWVVLAHHALSGLVPTGLTFDGQGNVQELRIPVPAGRKKYFVRIELE